MTYRLEAGAPLATDLRRVLVEELDEAAAELAALEPERFDDAIHEVRKSLKKSRTVLRLLRDALGRERYRAANGRLRDAGRALSGTRDAAVLVETLDGLLDAGPVGAAPYEGLRERLAGEYAAAHRAALADTGPVVDALERVRAGRADAACWDLDGDRDRDVLRGVRRVYRRGRDRLADAASSPTPEALHEWRKRAKDLGYSLRLVAPAWPAALEPLADEARRLWDLLGDDHDLHVLALAAGERADAFAVPADLEALCDLVAARRQRLQHDAFALGRCMYAERPKAFSARIGGYLEHWQG